MVTSRLLWGIGIESRFLDNESNNPFIVYYSDLLSKRRRIGESFQKYNSFMSASGSKCFNQYVRRRASFNIFRKSLALRN